MANVPLSITNWALKVHKGVEIELRSKLYNYLYPQNNDVLYAPLISIYACLPQVLHARAGSYSEGLVVVLQFKATVWPKVASEST